MIKALARCALFSLVLVPAASVAEPIKLKFAYFSSDRGLINDAWFKPFTEAVNAEAKGVLEIELHTGGKLGRQPAQQAQMVRDGVADIAFVSPDLTPDQFPDDPLISFPGLFKNLREATTTYTRLATSGAFDGYGDFFVVGAIANLPSPINSRLAIASLGDLKGQKIRTSSDAEGAVLRALGMLTTEMPVNETASAISRGAIDAASMPPSALFDFGISRVTRFHYFAPLAAAPLLILMNRKTFDGLPRAAQDVIRKYSGEWLAKRYIEIRETHDLASLERLKSEPERKVVFPAQSDLDAIQAVSRLEVEKWVAKSPHRRVVFDKMTEQLAKLRAGE